MDQFREILEGDKRSLERQMEEYKEEKIKEGQKPNEDYFEKVGYSRILEKSKR